MHGRIVMDIRCVDCIGLITGTRVPIAIAPVSEVIGERKASVEVGS
jgi:hypothetical protein